ncbi:MAG TPA: UDP-4-amino-4,6-dideoxy-N-acetyl-beta-L-altrosamine transaminase [Allosphingosinicella sp.]|nr:UDP-4-amino-4,6-dideoxy-N-acetyl-beta-L-altrosamine transaminase [Allosphingosinicella sp.]
MSNIDPVLPYGRQHVTDEDVAAVAEVLRSDWLTQGPQVEEFEAAIHAVCGAPYVVAVNSATSALHIACLALGVGPGDLVWTVPISFVASANCALYCGAEVDFVDVEADTANIDPEALAEKLSQAERTGRLPKVLIPVLFTGRPHDQPRVKALCDRYGVKIIEDASHAIGARGPGGEPVGSCRWSDITIFSFHPVKIVTTGEGGAAATRDPALAQRMAELRTHGITKERGRLDDPAAGGWYHEQQGLGFNYRLTDIQAALGTSQMTRLEQYVVRRNELAERYDALLAAMPLTRPPIPSGNGVRSAWHLYVIGLDPAEDGAMRRIWYDGLRARGIGVQVHYIPIHWQPYYRSLGFSRGMFPAAERFYEGALSIPMFAAMTRAEQDRVVAAIEDVAREGR